MNKHIQVFLAGVMVVVPLAVTIWAIIWIAESIGSLGISLVSLIWTDKDLVLSPYWGIPVILILLYVIGLMARSWVFRWFFRLVDSAVSSLPGIKTIYQSVRDLMKLFASDSSQMGRVVLYRQPGTQMVLLGIMTNDNPLGVADNIDGDYVAIYQPFSYMFGGPTIYVPASDVTPIDLPVDQALKLCATAHVGARAINNDQ